MHVKNERRGKKLDEKRGSLVGLILGIVLVVCGCLMIAALVSSGKLNENETGTFAIFIISIASLAASFLSAKISNVKSGVITCALMAAIRIIADAFSGGHMFAKTDIITVLAILLCGCAGAALGGRRMKHRRK